MATPPAVMAVIRAYRPSFRNNLDKLAFGVHGVLCVAGCRLLGVGTEAESTDPAVRFHADEATVSGWESTCTVEGDGYYAFMYAPPTQAAESGTGKTAGGQTSQQVLLVKAVPLGSELLVTLITDPCPEGHIPDTLELSTSHYCDSGAGPGTAPALPYSYNNLDDLVQKVQAALTHQADAASQAPAPATASAPAPSASPAGQRPPPPEEVDPLRDYSQPSRGPPAAPQFPHNPDPLSVGGHDMFPGGVPRPGRHPELGPLGGGGIGPGGGMHMGPGHPAFGGGGMFPDQDMAPRPGFGTGQGGPGPGMRWDPIAPPGLPGFRPGDFRPGGPGRGGRGIDPDIMQPGAGKGTDWDHMFG